MLAVGRRALWHYPLNYTARRRQLCLIVGHPSDKHHIHLKRHPIRWCGSKSVNLLMACNAGRTRGFQQFNVSTHHDWDVFYFKETCFESVTVSSTAETVSGVISCSWVQERWMTTNMLVFSGLLFFVTSLISPPHLSCISLIVTWAAPRSAVPPHLRCIFVVSPFPRRCLVPVF